MSPITVSSGVMFQSARSVQTEVHSFNTPWNTNPATGFSSGSALRAREDLSCFLTLTNSGGQNKLRKFNNLLIFYEGVL